MTNDIQFASVNLLFKSIEVFAVAWFTMINFCGKLYFADRDFLYQ